MIPWSRYAAEAGAPDVGRARGRILSLAAALLLAGLAGPASAQPPTLPRGAPPAAAVRGGYDAAGKDHPGPSTTPLAEALSRRGDLVLRGNTVGEALMTISELWKINIVAAEAPGTVNGVFKDAPLREILDAILISNGYGYRAVGESLVVTDIAKLGQVNPFFESATIPVTAAAIDEVVSGAKLLSTPQGQVRAIPSASSVFVLDFPDRVEMIREFLLSVESAARRSRGRAPDADGGAAGPAPLQVAYLKTHYVNAAAVEPVVRAVLSGAGRVAAMEQEDRLLVVDHAENLQMAAQVLRRVDRPLPQVNVRALIYDISLQDIESIGLNWQSLSGGNADSSIAGQALTAGAITSGAGAVLDSVTVTPPAAGATGSSFSFFTLGGDLDLAAVAVALQQAADSRLLASPNVTVVDNQEATIESVSEIPFQQLTETSFGGNIGTTAFRDAGVTLRVTPKVAHDGTIDMQVRPEFSRLTGFTPVDNQPIIDRRTAQTRVRVANGQTFVIAGLRQRTDVGDFRGVPLLKDLRLLGHLFRGRNTEVRESELVVFISPTVVGPATPLNCRQHATAETVRGRLRQIPAPEGGPPRGRRLGGTVVERVGLPADAIVGGAPDAASGPQPPTAEDLPAPPPRVPSKPPPPHETGPIMDPAVDGSLQYPRLGQDRLPLCRLPPISGPDADGVRTADLRAQRSDRLRPRYGDRFRATGGPYSAAGRHSTDDGPKPAEVAASKEGFWRRVLLR